MVICVLLAQPAQMADASAPLERLSVAQNVSISVLINNIAVTVQLIALYQVKTALLANVFVM